jgi:hypothetical protein
MTGVDWDKHRRQERLRKWLQDNSLKSPFWIHPPSLSSAEIGAWAKVELKTSLREIEYQLGINREFMDSIDSKLISKLQEIELALESQSSNILFSLTVQANVIFNSMKDYSIDSSILEKLNSIFDLLLTMTQEIDQK